jgi:hypothetical protein
MASTQNPLFVPLFLLEDPPKDYQPDKFAEDTWRVTEWRAIVDYHGYGFAYEMPITKAKIISVFKKISHNTRGGKQACCTGDVGPGLLKDGLLAKFGLQMPQATWTVTEANIQNYFTIPAYLRNAPVPRSKRSNNPILIKTKSGFPTITYFSSEQGQGTQTVDQGTTSPTSVKPDILVTKGMPTGLEKPETTGTGSSNNRGTSELATNPALTREVEQLTESVKRNLIDSAYSSLDRHEAAFPLTPKPFLNATSSKDLREAISLSLPASATIRLSWKEGTTQYAIDPQGRPARYYGKGPLWSNNSCWMDSVIVAGMLLQAGCTIADRAGQADWEQKLDTVGRGFLDALSMDWNFFDRKDSIAHRDRFRKLYTDNYNRRNPLQPLTMDGNHYTRTFWDEIAKGFHQFRYLGQVRSVCLCLPNRSVLRQAKWVKAIEPRTSADDNNATTMQTLAQRWFFETRHCGQCKQQSRATSNVVHGELPLRLVLQTNTTKPMPAGHTNDISFEYDSIETGKEIISRSKATYRWLGGVYYNPKLKHFRVFWTDDERGEPDLNIIRIYDGLLADGAIVGNLQYSKEKPKKVADPDWTTEAAPLLFYERVVLPTSAAIRGAKKAIVNILDAKSKGTLGLTRSKPRVQMKKRDIYRRSLQPFIFPDAGLRVSRLIGPNKVAVEVKDLAPPPTDTTSVTPKRGVLPTPPRTEPSKARNEPKIVGTGKPGDPLDVLDDFDIEETMATPTPGPNKVAMSKPTVDAPGNDSNNPIVLDVSDSEQKISTPDRGTNNVDVPRPTALGTPSQISGDQTPRMQGTWVTKRKEPDSGKDESGRPKKKPTPAGLTEGEPTADVVPSTTPNGTEIDVLDMSPEDLNDMFSV